MIKFFFPLVLILILISCKQRPKSTDVFEQNYPDSIPTIFAPDIISIKGRLEHGISFTPDNEELVFGVLNKEDFSGKIFHSKMGDKNWTKPIVFDPLKDESVFLPYFSPDGKSKLFA